METAKKAPTKWQIHLAEVRKQNPELSLKDCMKKAKITYVK
ncbi:MAG: hypothetical protein WCT77_00250 [Bacteroidota bacterium]|jgi:hypothetical protein